MYLLFGRKFKEGSRS